VIVLLAANVGGWVNRHFDYYPTLDALLGRRAADEAPVSSLDTSQVPAAGKVVELSIPATTSGFDARPAEVYVPPVWFEKPRPKLPVIVLLPGSPSQTDDWTRAGFADVTADAFAKEHRGKAPILVMADENGSLTNDTECVDGRLGKVEEYLTVDVPAFVERRFGPRPRRSSGRSRGCRKVACARRGDRHLWSDDPRRRAHVPVLGAGLPRLVAVDGRPARDHAAGALPRGVISSPAARAERPGASSVRAPAPTGWWRRC
jgi:hypothetical protein